MVVVLIIIGAVSEDTSQKEEATSSATSSASTASSTPSPSPSPSEPAFADEDGDGTPDGQECEQQMTPLLKALQEIDSRLDVGLTQSDLNGYLGDARVEYDRLRFGSIPQSCIVKVGVKLENAFNNYVKSNNRWNSCITNFGCDVDSIEPYLQKQWRVASKNVTKAARGLQQML